MSDKDQVFQMSLGGGSRRNTETQRSKLSLLRDQEATSSIATKLVEGFVPRLHDTKGNRKTLGPSQQLSQKVAGDTARMVSDAKNMMETLPDLEMVKQILVATILSPQDMMGGEINIELSNEDLGSIGAPLTSLISDYFKGTYKIEPVLPKMLEDILFMTGSYPIAVLPESAIDEAINNNERVSIENVAILSEYDAQGKPKSYGILGNNSTAAAARANLQPTVVMSGLESIFGGQAAFDAHGVSNYDADTLFGFAVTDNPTALRTPMLRDKVAREKIAGRYEAHSINGTNDGKGGLNDQTLRQLFRRRNYQFNPTLAMKTQDQLSKETRGHPLVMKLPSESVIPVHVPGDPTQHIGYFVMLDQTGNPVTLSSARDYLTNLPTNASSNEELKSSMLKAADRTMFGNKENQTMNHFELEQLYTHLVEDDLLSRLRNGVYGDNVQVSKPAEVMRIMFARACARQHTQLLYLPTDFMTYMAFDYNDFGVGKSLLEATKTVGVIRAMLMVANTLGALKNSTNHVNLDINLDPDDPEPAERVEQLVHEYVKTRQFGFPDRITSPADIADYIQAGGVSVTVSGNTGYPETKMTVEGRNAERAEVNGELDEAMKKRHYLGFGVSPEMVDRSMSDELATSLIQQNLLMAKRVQIYGKLFCSFLADHFQKYILNSRKLMDRLREIVKEMDAEGTHNVEGTSKTDVNTTVNTTAAKGGANDTEYERKIDLIVMHFVNSIIVTLPEPDLTKVDLQLEAFDKYSDGLDKVIPAFISSDMFDSNAMGDLSNSVPMTIAILKAHFQRRWLKKKNVLPELFDIISFTDNEGPALDLMKDQQAYMEGIEKSLKEFMVKAMKRATTNNEELQKANGGEEMDVVDTSDSGTGDAGTDDGTGGDDDFGSFDMPEEPAADEEPVVEEEPTADETPADEEPPAEEPPVE